MEETLIAFDESGNTGADLLNQEQPVFVLASVNFTEAEAAELLTHVETPQASEAKFTNLKKSNAGKQRILSFLKSDMLSDERVKIFIYHKRYMVETKIVDVLIEPIFRENGLDLYKDGANIATANMHFYCMPTFCGKDLTEQIFEKFVAMMRTQDSTSINDFYDVVEKAYVSCIDQEYKPSLAPILASEEIIKEILDGENARSIDPAIPAFFVLNAAWGDQLGHSFDLLHDDSKPIFAEKDTLELLMSKKGPYEEIGYDRRKFTFPLKANGVVFEDSKKDKRLQVADLLASCTAFWAQGVLNKSLQDEFWNQINSIDIKKLAIGACWPTTEVTPEKLGTVGGGEINAAEYIAKHLHAKEKGE